MKGRKRWNGWEFKRTDGQSIPIIALVIVILFGMVGLAVDVGNTYAEQRKAVNAANSAAIAGMEAYMDGTVDDNGVYNAIIGSLESNGVDTDEWQPLAYYKDSRNLRIGGCEVGSCGGMPSNVKYIEVQLQGEVDTFFARVVNQDTLPVNTTTWAAECPPGSGVFPIAVNGSTLDPDTGEFIEPENATDDQWGKFTGNNAFKGYTWRRLEVNSASVDGEFGWVRWMQGYTGEGDLAAMLNGDGNLDEGYQEVPEWPTTDKAEIEGYPVKPYQLNNGDWLYGHDGFSGGQVARLLAGHRIDMNAANDRGTIMILPVYGYATGEQGEDAKYLVSSLQKFLIMDYTNDGQYITLIAMGEVDHASACLTSPAASDTPGLTGRVSFNPEYATTNDEYKPVRYAVVLDVSGSMNFNFAGLGKNGKQCGNAPNVDPKTRPSCSPASSNAWETEEERRIYVAKNAIKHLISLTNMPGNDNYEPTLPGDEMMILGYQSRYDQRSMSEWSDDTGVLEEAVDDVGDAGGIYKTAGGTNGAAGLYLASQRLSGDNSVSFNGTKYEYKTVVIFVTDGVSNHLFHPQAPGYGAGNNNNTSYFPAGHLCASGDVHIPETVDCHINGKVIDPNFESREGKLFKDGRLYDRPITAMKNVSNEYLKNNGHEVHVVAISAIPSNGLQDGVATSPTFYAEARDLEVGADGKNNVDLIFENIYEKATGDACIRNTDPSKNIIESGNGLAGLPEGVYGRAYLEGEETYQTDILQDENGLYYRFDGVAEGTYTLSATIWYAHPDEEVDPRPVEYGFIYDETEEQKKPGVTVTITSAGSVGGLVEKDVTLAMEQDICAGHNE
jgi:hypothetical protein